MKYWIKLFLIVCIIPVAIYIVGRIDPFDKLVTYREPLFLEIVIGGVLTTVVFGLVVIVLLRIMAAVIEKIKLITKNK